MVFKGTKCDVLGWIHLNEGRKEKKAVGKMVEHFQDL
jgi:hypothetical protein